MIDPLLIGQLVIGAALFLFLPGYLLTLLIFSKQTAIERTMLGIVFSIMIGMTIGIFFGYDRTQAALTGGFIIRNLLISEIAITLVLALAVFIKRKVRDAKAKRKDPKSKEKKKKNN